MNLLINSLKRNTKTGVVESITWTATKTSADGRVQVKTQGEQVLVPKSPDDLDFVNYYEITQDTADFWLRQSFKDTGLKLLDEYLEAILEQEIAPQSGKGVPWKKEISTVSSQETEIALPVCRPIYGQGAVN